MKSGVECIIIRINKREGRVVSLSKMRYPYELVRSNRKTLALEIRLGKLTVRAPMKTDIAEINRFLESRADWIEKHITGDEQQKKESEEAGKLSMEEIRKLADDALRVIPQRVAYYAPLVGVTYGRITIRNQRTKWGSCTENGNLNFNCLLMLTPPEVLDSIVVHELCHRKEMNHSKQFYAEVLRVYPEYRKGEKWLKEHGTALLMRMLEP